MESVDFRDARPGDILVLCATFQHMAILASEIEFVDRQGRMRELNFDMFEAVGLGVEYSPREIYSADNVIVLRPKNRLKEEERNVEDLVISRQALSGVEP